MREDALLKIANFAKEIAEDHTAYENEAFAAIANSLYRLLGREERVDAGGIDYVEGSE